MRGCCRAGCRGRTQCEERCEDGEHMCSPLHYRLPDTTQQHQTHHGYSYPPSSHLSSHRVRPLQPSTAVTHCLTASYPLQHFYNTLQHSRVYSATAVLQSTTSTTPLCAHGHRPAAYSHPCTPSGPVWTPGRGPSDHYPQAHQCIGAGPYNVVARHTASHFSWNSAARPSRWRRS